MFSEEEKFIINMIILTFGLGFTAWQVRELKKSTHIQAYQNVLRNYIDCCNFAQFEPLYKKYFDKMNIDDKSILLFSALMNTFEMLCVQKTQKIIGDDVWNPWKNYFIELLKLDVNYQSMWNVLKDKNIYHKDIVELINKELKIS